MYCRYGLMADQREIRESVGATSDLSGNFCHVPRIVPDQLAPVMRVVSSKDRELTLMRWGFPNPSGASPVTEVRNTTGEWWRPWLEDPKNRCLIPATCFSMVDRDNPSTIKTWYPQDEGQALMWFAGIWRKWEGKRGSGNEAQCGPHLLFCFLTVNAGSSRLGEPTNPPVILLTQKDREMWLDAPLATALTLQRPLPHFRFRLQLTKAGEHEN
jgi:putative SOS response-associated peptidase YedK